MNDIKNDVDKNEENHEQNNEIVVEKYKYNNNFEIDVSKYNLDFSTKLNSMNLYLKPISKQKLINQIFLASSNLNLFNKMISLEKLYTIYDSEKNFNMIYYIISNIMKYIKSERISVFMLNTNLSFCSEFLSNNQNYFFAYKYFFDIKQINNNITFDKIILKEINEFIRDKIDYHKNYFLNLTNNENISILKTIIDNILNDTNLIEAEENEDKNIKKENVSKEDENNQYLYLINKNWLSNAKIFIGNFLFALETKITTNFFIDSFDIENVSSVFLSEEKKEKPIESKTYFPFPGPINNFPLTEFKDILFDPISTEENIIIKKNLTLKKDFYWINHKDWSLLKEAFGYTNEIKRKKDELEMIQLSAFIFDSRMREYKNESINYMRKKIIQISSKKTVKDLEIKIKRCLDNEIKNLVKKNEKNNQIKEEIEKNEMEIYFYKISKKNKDILIEIISSFITDIQTYESIFLEEIIFSEEEKKKNNIESIFKKYNPKTELIIIEINHIKKNPRFLKPIMPILNLNKQLVFNCSICDKEIIDLNIKNNICQLCSIYLFCSKECLDNVNNKENNKIKDHKKLHDFLSELKLKPFKINEFLPINFYNEMYAPENKNKSKGVVGLFNLGNTCYMNCSLQCLSNTKDLTKYFLNYKFQNEINLQTTFGSNGVLVKAYSDLINLMWLSKFIKINPYFFRIAFIISTNKFRNNYQQDAMEFILILLNYLHEDLNRIKEKPYLILNEQKEKESDVLASQRYYTFYLKRENSIITDLFSGQFQNIIKCTTCLTENKTYEPFNHISLPIPEEHNFYIFKFFSNNNCKYVTMNVNSKTTFEDLIKKASNFLSKKIIDSFNEMIKKDKGNEKYYQELFYRNIEIAKLDKNKIIHQIYLQEEDNQKLLSKYLNNKEELVLFEKEILPDYHQNIYVYPVITNSKDVNDIKFLSYPVMFSVKHDLTLENLEKIIVEKLNSILINNIDMKNQHIIDLHILHSNKNMNTGIMGLIKDYQKCTFCNYDYSEKKYCPLYLYFNKNDTISKIFKLIKYPTPFILLARSSYYDLNKEVYPGFNFEENDNLNSNKNIYDSFNQFGNYEILGEDNLWNCNKCSAKRKIGKCLKIYRPPKYLIIQLKRFKKKGTGFFSFLEGDKNETFVWFPTKNLDLSNYIAGPNKNNSIYNLYAVINHKNFMGVNHFTSFCRNNKRWIEYDDQKINCDIKNPITREAYILFYIQKNIDENY